MRREARESGCEEMREKSDYLHSSYDERLQSFVSHEKREEEAKKEKREEEMNRRDERETKCRATRARAHTRSEKNVRERMRDQLLEARETL